ncbi:lactonase family protein [Saccharicrinis aurantiacus]|uniref:lactonase family protein n=1 Tax=Saccharicrinis aurantiacus TaxID=1849719 RepID=UPI00094FBC48|nr:lactonase family protein [Saccharicrinis aurantiacus]
MKNIALSLLLVCLFGCSSAEDHTVSLFVGTAGKSATSGISVCKFDTLSGALSEARVVAHIPNCNYLHISNDGNYLFSVAQDSDNRFMIHSYQILENDSLQFISSVNSLGNDPCFVEYIDEKNLLISANYSSGSIAYFKVSDQGVINKGKSISHTGSGPNKGRQKSPHAHSIRYDYNNGFFYAADLGADKVMVYALEGDDLVIRDSIMCNPGDGPRHLDFHPDNSMMAVVNELSMSVTTYALNEEGIFKEELQTLTLVPASFEEPAKAADIHFSQDGKYLYASNRGFDAIGIFKVNADSKLDFLEFQTEGVSWPRNFNVTLKNWLLLANRDDNQLRVFALENNGLLKASGSVADSDLPICIKVKK